MTVGIFMTVLFAALLHAGWNALVKGGAEKGAAMIAVSIGQGIAGLLVLPFVSWPTAEAMVYLPYSIALHVGYQSFLIAAYRMGDFTQVYPIARGVAPLLVTAVSIAILGASFSSVQLMAIGLIAIGIMSISLVRNGEGTFQWQGAVLALITGAFIAGYSVVDGLGARAGGTAVGYFGLQAAINGVIFTVLSLMVRPASVRSALRLPTHLVLGGGASFVAYALVVYAFMFAPIAMVTALRETSIIFALIIGSVVFHERVNFRKVAAAMSTICGVIVLRVYRG